MRRPSLARGQALVELVLVAPLLLLLTLGLFQFSMLFLARTQFEHACGEAGREYAAGLISDAGCPRVIWENLGNYQSLFFRDSLRLREEKPSSALGPLPMGQTFQSLTSMIQNAQIGGSALDYEGKRWTAEILYNASPLFTRGIPFRTVFSVLRHPKASL